MSDPTDAPEGAGATALASSAPAIEPNDAPTASDLGRMLAGLRTQKPDDAPEAAAPDPELAPEANAAPPEEAPSEDTNAAEPAEVPPIEPPRSWTQAEKERFQSLPRETQEYLHTREQEREREFRRSQNEAADIRKAAQAEREAAEKARKDYEAKLPSVMQALQDAQAGDFADIRTVDDVTRLAAEDPFKYLQWQAHQTKLQAVNAEMQRAESDRQKAQQSEWQSFIAEQGRKLTDIVPEAEVTKYTPKAGEFLDSIGFTESERNGFVSGDKISLFDHRVQRLILNAMKYEEAQKAKPVALPKSVPQVQRPGVAQPKSDGTAIQALSKKHEQTGSARDLGALIGALRRA